MRLRGPIEHDRGDRWGCLGGFGLGGMMVGALETTLGPAGVIAGDVEVASASVGMTVSDIEAALGLVGVIADVVEVALGAAALYWLGGVKQNSSEAKPLSCEHLVGVTRFELVTSSVSGKRSPPELNARSRVRECAGNNITELPPSGKNIFQKPSIQGAFAANYGANCTRKPVFVPPMNCAFT